MSVRPPWLPETARPLATGGRHRVWRICVGGRELVAKRFGPGRGFAQAWAARRSVEGRDVAPPLRWVDRGERLIVSDWVGEVQPASAEDWRALGRTLARLHTCPVAPDSVGLGRAYGLRLDSLRREGDAEVGNALESLELQAGLAGITPWLDAQVRVLCHRDLQACNVRMAQGKAMLLDFEHATADVWLSDLVKLWAFRPDRIEAVLEGYRGSMLSPDEGRAMAVLAGLFAVSTWWYGRRHADAAILADGRALLERLQGRVGE